MCADDMTMLAFIAHMPCIATHRNSSFPLLETFVQQHASAGPPQAALQQQQQQQAQPMGGVEFVYPMHSGMMPFQAQGQLQPMQLCMQQGPPQQLGSMMAVMPPGAASAPEFLGGFFDEYPSPTGQQLDAMNSHAGAIVRRFGSTLP